MQDDVPSDACPKCGKPLKAHGLDFASQSPLVVVTCPLADGTASKEFGA